MRRWLFFALAAIVLPGGMAARADDGARIVFYRMYHIDNDGAKYRIRIGDSDVGAVADGDGTVIHVPAGAVVFKIDAPRTLGHLDFPMTLESGKTYYVALAAKPGSSRATDFDEQLGQSDVKPNATCGGDWCAATVPEKDAMVDFKAIRFTPPP
ncbi:MAG TPA: hypothetical protein VGG10_16525 [Rhizomicrobium sp.]|jgi:hypothetical protein